MVTVQTISLADLSCDRSAPFLPQLFGIAFVHLIAFLASLVFCLSFAVTTCHAQNDFYPLPERNPSGFGFPYPPSAPDEPGVTFNRRYMLDGHPELEFNPRPQDEVWLISTREVETDQATINQLVCKVAVGNSWNQIPVSSLIDAQRSDPGRQTVVFVHGNRTPALWARRRGKHAYQVLFARNANQNLIRSNEERIANELPPVRFVIWSWPSDPLPRFFKDFAAKMDRAVVDGILFGKFLSQIDHAQPLRLISYSLGTQIAFTGVETVAAEAGSCPPIDLISMAPVTHCRWPLSERQVQTTADHIQRLRLFRNDDDIAIKAYKIYCRIGCQCSFEPGADAIQRVHSNVQQTQLGDSVGCEHNVLGYVSQPEVRDALESLMRR